MKTKVKLVFSAVATLALVAFFQIGTTKADMYPVKNCEYTGNPNHFCVVGDVLEVYNCVNNAVTTSCGINIEEIQ